MPPPLRYLGCVFGHDRPVTGDWGGAIALPCLSSTHQNTRNTTTVPENVNRSVDASKITRRIRDNRQSTAPEPRNSTTPVIDS